jgi:hypothetical protein
VFKNNSPLLSVHGEREFRVEEEIVYTGKWGTFTVPVGFITDFASVPTVVQWLIPSYGKYTLAAIIHDYFCVQLAEAHKAQKRWEEFDIYSIGNDPCEFRVADNTYASPPPAEPNSRDTDAIFRRIMRELDVPFLRRWVMWTGVRWGAVANPARRKGVSRDLWRMVLWSILSAPVVVPATLAVGLGLLIDRIFEAVIGRFLK